MLFLFFGLAEEAGEAWGRGDGTEGAGEAWGRGDGGTEDACEAGGRGDGTEGVGEVGDREPSDMDEVPGWGEADCSGVKGEGDSDDCSDGDCHAESVLRNVILSCG